VSYRAAPFQKNVFRNYQTNQSSSIWDVLIGWKKEKKQNRVIEKSCGSFLTCWLGKYILKRNKGLSGFTFERQLFDDVGFSPASTTFFSDFGFLIRCNCGDI